tara:strand:- start:159 stop:893 length:735 start_codon:yes stop_codon:yes gene_type:complete
LREYKVNRVIHRVFEPDDKVPHPVHDNWKTGEIGQWVRADDDCVIQVLRKGKLHDSTRRNKVREYIGTCTGTFIVSPKTKMDTSRRTNIYSIGGGKNSDDILLDRTILSKAEQVFVVYLASGMAPKEAYMKAFPTNNPTYASMKSTKLVKQKRILTAMKEELKPIMKDLDLDESYVLKAIKQVIETSDKDETRLKALFKLSDIMDLEDKTKVSVTQTTGVLLESGIKANELEEIKIEKQKITGG